MEYLDVNKNKSHKGHRIRKNKKKNIDEDKGI